MRRELNDAWLRGLKPPQQGRLEVWDTRVGGLMLRLTPSGAATWSLRARTHSDKRTRPTLGIWPGLGIAEARRRALAELAAIHGGADPVAQKRAARADRAAREAEPTVAERVEEWLAARVSDRAKPLKPRTAAEYRRAMERDVLPRIGARPLRETMREDWTRLVAAKRRRAPAMASLLYRCASAFLGHAEAHGWVAASPLPRRGLVAIAPPLAARERVLSDSELHAVWRASAGLNPKPRAFVRLLALTAAREMEVADVAAGEVDRAARRWTIPGAQTKNGLPHTVPLCTLALAEIAAVWPGHDDEAGPDWRLLGAVAGSGLRGFSKLKAKLDALSGVTGWRWHDLRRTARTGMARLGVPRDHAEAAINHASGRSALERTYDRHDDAAEVIAALARWQAHVTGLVRPGAEAYAPEGPGDGSPAGLGVTPAAPVLHTRHKLRRSAAALALLLASAGCAGRGAEGGPRAATAGPVPPPGFTADTSTREGLAGGAAATEAGCRALPDGLWVGARDGRRECLRYAAAGTARGGGHGPASRTALVHLPGDAAGVGYRFAGGRPQVEGVGDGYAVPAEARRAAAEALSAAAGGTPVILLARPGMHGSSGDHARDRHTRAEVELVDAALTELRRRHGFQGFVLSGFSSGGAVAANLLARRSDVSCAVLASAPLDLAAFYRGPDGSLPDHYAMRGGDFADPMRAVGAIRPHVTIFVLGDRRDRKVPAAAWEAWAEAARRAGLRVAAAEISGFDPAEPAGAASFHQTAARGMAAALACAAAAGGGHPDPVAAGLDAGRPPPPPLLPRAVW